MSNLAVMRALRRRINFYSNTPAFKKYSRSLKDFLIVMGLTFISLLPLLVATLWALEDGDMTGIGSCGTRDCTDQ